MPGISSYWVTGPCPIYVGLKSGAFVTGDASPQFLGYAESFPRMEFRPGWYPVMSDPTGPEKPADMSFASMDAVIAFNLTLWDERIAQSMEVFPGPGLAGGAPAGGLYSPGTWSFNDIGTLMMTEGYAFDAWVQFPFGGATAGPTGHPFMSTLPSGYHFKSCLHLGPWVPEPGAKPFKRQMVWLAWPKMKFTNRTLSLFDYDMSAIASLAQPPSNLG